jgi:two-component sensor histidine kinase
MPPFGCGNSGRDWRNAKSPGLRLVISLVEQLQDAVELDHSEGMAFKIIVKDKE